MSVCREAAVASRGALRGIGLTLAAYVSIWASVGGRIAGTITDPSGAIIQAAAVTAINDGTHVVQRVATAQDGSYAFPVLPVGVYSIRVAVPGFQPYERTGIAVDDDG